MNSWLAQTGHFISISTGGFNAVNNGNDAYQTISAEKGFHISMGFSEPVFYYFEVTIMSSTYR
jgi:hypothetical protein